MIYMNEIMKEIIYKNDNITKMYTDRMVDNIIANVKLINECIVYDNEGNIQEQQIDFDKIITFSGDLTGYEIGVNDIRIDKECVTIRDCMALGDGLCDALERKYSGKKFVVYILIYDESIELRFHTYREEDGLWLDEDLNKYNEPVFYIMN